jgi:hypothetical protein
MTPDPGDLAPAWERLRRFGKLPALRAERWQRASVTLAQAEAVALLAQLPVQGGWALRLGEKPVLEWLEPDGTDAEDRRPILGAEAVLGEGAALQVTQAPLARVILAALWNEAEAVPAALAARLGAAETQAVMVRDELRPGHLAGGPVRTCHAVAFAIAGPDAPGAALRLEGLALPWAFRLREITPDAGVTD